jgi:hypothetical protein
MSSARVTAEFWGCGLKNVWRDIKTYDAKLFNLAEAPQDPTSDYHKIVTADGRKLRCHEVRNALTELHVYQEVEDLRRLGRAQLERHFPTIHSLIVDHEGHITAVLMTFEWDTRRLKDALATAVPTWFKESLRTGLFELAKRAHDAGYNWAPRVEDIHYYTAAHGGPIIFVPEIAHEGGRAAGNPQEEGSSTKSLRVASLEDIFSVLDTIKTDDSLAFTTDGTIDGRKQLRI